MKAKMDNVYKLIIFLKITFSEVGILSKFTNIWLLKHRKIYENGEMK